MQTTRGRARTVVLLTLSVGAALVLMAGPAFLVKDGALTFIGWRLADWWVEGSEITFAFARNLASGAGFVATPGGERVEGFTSPAWLALLTLWQLAGVDGFVSSKIMAVLFTAITIVLSWALAREVLDEDEQGAAAGAGAAGAGAAGAQPAGCDVEHVGPGAVPLPPAADGRAVARRGGGAAWRAVVERRALDANRADPTGGSPVRRDRGDRVARVCGARGVSVASCPRGRSRL